MGAEAGRTAIPCMSGSVNGCGMRLVLQPEGGLKRRQLTKGNPWKAEYVFAHNNPAIMIRHANQTWQLQI